LVRVQPGELLKCLAKDADVAPRPRAGFGRRFGYFILAATAVWFALVGAIVVAYGWEELQGIGYFVGLLAFVALMGVLALWN
jgi:hypothetical protein